MDDGSLLDLLLIATIYLTDRPGKMMATWDIIQEAEGIAGEPIDRDRAAGLIHAIPHISSFGMPEHHWVMV